MRQRLPGKMRRSSGMYRSYCILLLETNSRLFRIDSNRRRCLARLSLLLVGSQRKCCQKRLERVVTRKDTIVKIRTTLLSIRHVSYVF